MKNTLVAYYFLENDKKTKRRNVNVVIKKIAYVFLI